MNITESAGLLRGWSRKRKFKAAMLAVPLLAVIAALILILMPVAEIDRKKISIRTLEIPAFPIIVVLEQEGGSVTSAWLRTPAGARRLDRLEGLSFISSEPIITRVDQDSKDDLLWRLSFMNIDGEGLNLWLGMTTWAPRVFIACAPLNYTRWHALPAKVEVPKGTSIYIAPAAPLYQNLDKQFRGKDSYSFIYTMMLTPEGLNFVPVPSVYKQLSVLLQAGMRGESSPQKRLAYVRMLTEFNRLADGKAPQADTLLNLQVERLDTLSWKR
ncbi:MAG: hypothetical protein Q4D58_01975 [Synergistaceae bacterium]|nr:hypothetical protein [Synergistaceae bacterium]